MLRILAGCEPPGLCGAQVSAFNCGSDSSDGGPELRARLRGGPRRVPPFLRRTRRNCHCGGTGKIDRRSRGTGEPRSLRREAAGARRAGHVFMPREMPWDRSWHYCRWRFSACRRWKSSRRPARASRASSARTGFHTPFARRGSAERPGQPDPERRRPASLKVTGCCVHSVGIYSSSCIASGAANFGTGTGERSMARAPAGGAIQTVGADCGIRGRGPCARPGRRRRRLDRTPAGARTGEAPGMTSRTLPSRASTVLLAGLLALAAVLSDARPTLAQEACPRPAGATAVAPPEVTAAEVENGTGALADFALAARERSREHARGGAGPEQGLYIACLIRQEDGVWRSGSTYLVSLTPDGRVFVHARNMALSGRLLDPHDLRGDPRRARRLAGRSGGPGVARPRDAGRRFGQGHGHAVGRTRRGVRRGRGRFGPRQRLCLARAGRPDRAARGVRHRRIPPGRGNDRLRRPHRHRQGRGGPGDAQGLRHPGGRVFSQAPAARRRGGGLAGQDRAARPERAVAARFGLSLRARYRQQHDRLPRGVPGPPGIPAPDADRPRRGDRTVHPDGDYQRGEEQFRGRLRGVLLRRPDGRHGQRGHPQDGLRPRVRRRGPEAGRQRAAGRVHRGVGLLRKPGAGGGGGS